MPIRPGGDCGGTRTGGPPPIAASEQTTPGYRPCTEAGLVGYSPPDTPTFPDVPVGFWAYKHVEYCVEHEVVQGYADGWYYPGNVVTRDQMAVYVKRAFGLP